MASSIISYTPINGILEITTKVTSTKIKSARPSLQSRSAKWNLCLNEK